MPTSNAPDFSLEGGWPAIMRDLGVDPRAVLRRAELPGDLLAREGARLPTPEYFRLWNAVEAEAGGPGFVLPMTEVVRAGVFHPCIFAALCSSDLRSAAGRVAQYKRLFAPMRLVLKESREHFSLEFQWLDRTVQPPASLAAFELLFFVELARIGTRERIKPAKVETVVALSPANDLARWFGVRPVASKHHRVSFSRADAERPFLTANESMWKAFEPDLRRRLADLERNAGVEERVRATLVEALPGGESSMDEVARRLGMSKRTLQRRLREEATTFQAVLKATREDLARHYLAKTELSGAEISYLLGFSDPNSFFRAFHAWTGTTTEQVRHAH